MDGVSREQNYYGTLFHEMIHWTGHKSRLKRKSIENYDSSVKDRISVNLCALEEITAELGANMLLQYFGLQSTFSVYSLKYINTELNSINRSKRTQMYLKAVKQATKAFEYIIRSFD